MSRGAGMRKAEALEHAGPLVGRTLVDVELHAGVQQEDFDVLRAVDIQVKMDVGVLGRGSVQDGACQVRLVDGQAFHQRRRDPAQSGQQFRVRVRLEQPQVAPHLAFHLGVVGHRRRARIAQQFLHRAALRLAVLAAFLGDQARGRRGDFRTKFVIRWHGCAGWGGVRRGAGSVATGCHVAPHYNFTPFDFADRTRFGDRETSVHIHILGICGTFMGGLAQLARAAGHRVSGCDANVYPPMSDQLAEAGIELIEGFEPGQLELRADLYVVGNVVTRGNALMEAILDRQLPFVSGPQWLAEHVLRGRHVLAVAGTHGKTTTTSMLAWILSSAGLDPGFLVGGVPQDFGRSAQLGAAAPFVIEADEYDTAFFDKRSKFIHYLPRTAVLNNLEFDHADIFPDLAAIETQFHHFVRTLSRSARVVVNAGEPALARVLARGCWSERVTFGDGGEWEVGRDAPHRRHAQRLAPSANCNSTSRAITTG